MKKILLASITSLLLGCNSNLNFTSSNNSSSQKSSFSFSIKALPITYVKSITARLIRDPNDPNSVSSIISSVDQDLSSSNTTITFSSVPTGGPYYVAIAAYDGLVSNNLRKNVTKENLNITTEEKRWAISTNNVNVTSSSATYSDSLTSLNVILKIILTQASTTITITPQNGSSTSGSITVTPKS
jgi:hypothetical protein